MENYKLSNYTVITDIINENELVPKQIIYSTRSGRAAVVNSSVIRNIQSCSFDGIPEDVLLELFSMDMIVPFDEIEFERVMEQNRLHLNDQKVLSITMQPGANCQLGCHYCGQKHEKHYLSEDMYDKVVNRIGTNIKKGDGKYEILFITWYGGEPLMAYNQIRQLSPRFLEFTKQNGLGYMSNMITNGLSLKENIFTELVEVCKVNHFQITIDGTKENHDKRRITKSGESTYDIILQNIINCTNLPIFRSERCGLAIRMNIDHTNSDSILDFLHELASHNLQDKISLQFSPIVDWGDNNASEKSLNKTDFAEIEIDWFMEAHKLGFNYELVPARSYGPCMVVNPDSEVYDAYGNIYPCYEMPYTDAYKDPKFLIGNLKFDEATYNNDAFTRSWFNDVVQGKSTCRECRFFPVCGGGCPKQWLLGTPACPSFKFNMEDRLVLQYLLDHAKITELA